MLPKTMKMEMLTKLKQKGKQTSAHEYLHNFRNTYLDEEELRKPTAQEAEELRLKTLDQISNSLAKKQAPTTNKMQSRSLKIEDAKYINYTPSSQLPGHNSGASQRIIKMTEAQKDPLAPALFKHKKIPAGQRSPPKAVYIQIQYILQIMHSPQRKLTAQDQLDWKIPPCVSNWKNSKGYTIPLEMRLQQIFNIFKSFFFRADGRQLQHITINEKHSKVTNALYIVEREARKELEERNKIQKLISQKEFLQKETEMKEAAQSAREEKNKLLQQQQEEPEVPIPSQEKLNINQKLEKEQRDQIRYMQKRETERDFRIEAAGRNKAKLIRDQERDISEKVALGQAQPTLRKELQFDQRLFNQESGLEGGFGSDDEYKMFDKPLFADRTAANFYSAKETQEENDNDGGLKNILNSKRPQREFDGATENVGGGRRPVEFEKHLDPAFQMKATAPPDDIGNKIYKKIKKN